MKMLEMHAIRDTGSGSAALRVMTAAHRNSFHVCIYIAVFSHI